MNDKLDNSYGEYLGNIRRTRRVYAFSYARPRFWYLKMMYTPMIALGLLSIIGLITVS